MTDARAAGRDRTAFVIVLGAIVVAAIAALVALRIAGIAFSPLGDVIGAIGSFAIGALAAQLGR